MEIYKFSNNVHEIEGMYGVDYSSIMDDEKSLFEINSYTWTSILVETLIKDAKELSSDENLEFKAEGSNLFMVIDKDEVYFYNSHNSNPEPDFVWLFDEFISFMESFKEFLLECEKE